MCQSALRRQTLFLRIFTAQTRAQQNLDISAKFKKFEISNYINDLYTFVIVINRYIKTISLLSIKTITVWAAYPLKKVNY